MSSLQVVTSVLARTDAANLGWQHTQVNQDVQSWFPAVHSQMGSFRVREHQLLQLQQHLATNDWHAKGPVVDPSIDEWFPAIHDQTQSFLSRKHQLLALHNQASTVQSPGLWPVVDANVERWFSAVHAQTQQYRSAGRPKLSLPAHLSTHQEHSWNEPLVQSIPGFTYGAIGQLLSSFRSLPSPRLSPLVHLETPKDGWPFSAFIKMVQTSIPAVVQLLGSFRSVDRARLVASIHSMDRLNRNIDPALITPDEYNASRFSAIQELLNSFRMAEGEKLDLYRHLEGPDFDWLMGYAEVTVPSIIHGAMEQLLNSFRTPSRAKLVSSQHMETIHGGELFRAVIEFVTTNMAPHAALLNSFRMPAGTMLDPERHLTNVRFDGTAAYLATLPTFTRGALEQLLNSFISPAQPGLVPGTHAMASLNRLMLIDLVQEQFSLEQYPAIAQLLSSFIVPDLRIRNLSQYTNLVDETGQYSVVVPKYDPIYYAGIVQLLDTFRSQGRPVYDPRLARALEPTEWILSLFPGAESVEIITDSFAVVRTRTATFGVPTTLLRLFER